MSAERTILKHSGLSRVVPIVVWVFCALACIDGIVEGTVGFAVRTIVVLSAVALATWLVLFSPYLGVDAEGVRIVNPFTDVTVPFGALVGVQVGGTVSVIGRFADGRERKITSWNAPGVRRRRPKRAIGGIGGSGAAGMLSHAPDSSNPQELAAALPTAGSTRSQVETAVDHFETRWQREHPDGDPLAVASTSLRWPAWLILAVLIAVNVAIWLR